MSQTQEVRGVKTAVFVDDEGMTRVIYRGNCVVAFDQDKIVLDTCGWPTHTTRTRMNQASNQFALGYRVYQKDFRWYVEIDGMKLPLQRRLVLKRKRMEKAA